MAGMNPVELRIIIDAQNKASAVLKKAQKDIDKLKKGVADVSPVTAGMEGGFARMGSAAKRGKPSGAISPMSTDWATSSTSSATSGPPFNFSL